MKRNKKIVILLIVLTIILLVVYVVLQTALTKWLFFVALGVLSVYLAVTHEKLEMR